MKIQMIKDKILVDLTLIQMKINERGMINL